MRLNIHTRMRYYMICKLCALGSSRTGTSWNVNCSITSLDVFFYSSILTLKLKKVVKRLHGGGIVVFTQADCVIAAVSLLYCVP